MSLCGYTLSHKLFQLSLLSATITNRYACMHVDATLNLLSSLKLANIDLDCQLWYSDDKTMMYLEKLCGLAEMFLAVLT